MLDHSFVFTATHGYLLAGCLAGILILTGILLRRRRAPVPHGGGMAAALVLDGDLSGARSIFEARAKQSGPDFVDSVVGLVAVLRAQGDLHRAKSLIESLRSRRPAPWVDGLLVRLRMDSGDLAGAVELVRENKDIPSDLAVAALARVGAWAEALEVYKARTPRKQRRSSVESILISAVGFSLLRTGDTKNARKAFSKARRASASNHLADLGQALLQADGEELRFDLDGCPWAVVGNGETFEIVQSSHIVTEAVRIRESDGLDRALGVMRAHLDGAPHDWSVRSQYIEWTLEVDDPRFWRSELKEILEVLKNEPRLSIKGYCKTCGFETHQPLIVCPRCDAVGLMGAARPDHLGKPRYLESAQGTDLYGLLTEGD